MSFAQIALQPDSFCGTLSRGNKPSDACRISLQKGWMCPIWYNRNKCVLDGGKCRYFGQNNEDLGPDARTAAAAPNCLCAKVDSNGKMQAFKDQNDCCDQELMPVFLAAESLCELVTKQVQIKTQNWKGVRNRLCC
jgi:hypothetical protein